MPRALAVPFVLVIAAALAGCESDESPPLPPGAAPPQQASLRWIERFPGEGPALVFEATSFAVTTSGWTADVGVENESGVAWRIAEHPTSFGVMLFTTDEVGEVEERSRDDDLPGLRPARRFEPPLPTQLAPGERWSGTISAPGKLAAGLYVRLVFGTFVAVGDTPEGMQAQFSWITDNSYLLEARSRGRAA